MTHSRRRALAGLGALVLTPWLPAHARDRERATTPALTEGPFYPRAHRNAAPAARNPCDAREVELRLPIAFAPPT